MNAQVQARAASPDVLLERLEGVQRQGRGWRARCPSCGGTSRKLTVAESDDRVLVHCFGGCKVVDVLTAVGMTFADLMPPKSWPQTREERRKAQRAIREVGLLSAFEVLMVEGQIIEAAARQIARWQPLSVDDDARLALAVERASKAVIALRDFDYWARRNPA